MKEAVRVAERPEDILVALDEFEAGGLRVWSQVTKSEDNKAIAAA